MWWRLRVCADHVTRRLVAGSDSDPQVLVAELSYGTVLSAHGGPCNQYTLRTYPTFNYLAACMWLCFQHACLRT